MNIRYPLLFSILSLNLCSLVRADLLVYEGFDGYTNGSIHNQAVSANTTGLTGNYNAFVGDMTVSDSGGLSFSNLLVSGGLLSTTNSTIANGTGVTLGISKTTTVYSSFLINLGATPSSNSFQSLSMNSTTGGSASNRFNSSQADNNINGQTDTAVRYIGSPASGGNGSGVTLASNTTFLVITEYAQDAGTGSVTNWFLTESQFNTLITNDGSITLSGLNGLGAVTASSTNSLASNRTFEGAFQILMGFATASTSIDELRVGDSLGDVTPIPEPSTFAALFALAIGGVTVFMRRKRS